MAETKRTVLEEPEVEQAPNQQIDRMETVRRCASFERVDLTKPCTYESVQVHNGRADQATEVELSDYFF